ncbi:hypothetical protein B0A50_02341 [Salinomyces thailandicus]|uniref:S-adenosyl-L-methionine-dependent methyltransferase n=1 Tax=Salinomyces thailandicus TaxID=706561 RepID=A0A4U0U619_9PEZI|nr:hypothetical protein B0A50_02341 [Salinomyces thailandica]
MAQDGTTSDYPLPPPSMGPEAERLNTQHVLLSRTFGGLYRAPLDVSKPQCVLDVGCGTGIWSVDFAKQYPNIQVYGFDINESPDWANAPANCHFRAASLEDAETWEQLGHKFDFIFSRLIVPSVKNWPLLMRRYWDSLEPGGFMETHDLQLPFKSLDGTTSEQSKFMQFWEHLLEAMPKVGLDPGAMDRLPIELRGLGFAKVEQEEFRMLSGPWSDDAKEQELGRLGAANFKTVSRHSSPLLVKALGWSEERRVDFVAGVEREIDECWFKTFLPLKITIAQKPERDSAV